MAIHTYGLSTLSEDDTKPESKNLFGCWMADTRFFSVWLGPEHKRGEAPDMDALEVRGYSQQRYSFNLASRSASIVAVSDTGTMSAVPDGIMGQSPIIIWEASLASTTKNTL